MKRLITVPLIAVMALTLLLGCADAGPKRFVYAYFDCFDTVTELTLYANTQSEANEAADYVHRRLIYLNKLFDIYHEYEGVTSLKTVNDNAAAAPVAVAEETVRLMLFAKKAYDLTGGTVNAAMGSVLSIWHEYRENGLEHPKIACLPDINELKSAYEHTDMAAVIIDEAESTIYFTDPELKLDVGATAKGFAAQLVAEELSERGVGSALLSLGGNVCALGTKPDGSMWNIAVQDPRSDGSIGRVAIGSQSLVTSGDYQRFYTVDGVRYNHIIDPQTLMSADRFLSVTVMCDDGAMADALSTALFIMDYEEGSELIAAIDGAEALWINKDGTLLYTSGFDIK